MSPRLKELNDNPYLFPLITSGERPASPVWFAWVADIKRVELALLRSFHPLRLWTAHLVRTSSAKPHIYDIIPPIKHPDNRTQCLLSRYIKGMKCIHTIYGASTTTLLLTDYSEIVQISMSQNTKRIVNAFLIHKSICRLLAVSQSFASSPSNDMP